jgi:hypothetical protein
VSLADRAVALQLLRLSLDRNGIDVTLEASFAMAGMGMEPLQLDRDVCAWRTHPRTNTKSVAARTRRRWPTAALHVGLRKAALTRLAEVGCTVHQIAAISGHKTLREVQRYTEKAEQAKLAREAMERTTAAQKKQGAA